jgi:hypothetical protein
MFIRQCLSVNVHLGANSEAAQVATANFQCSGIRAVAQSDLPSIWWTPDLAAWRCACSGVLYSGAE